MASREVQVNLTINPQSVLVLVHRELLAELGEWSQPVQAMIIETPGEGTGWEMTFRAASESGGSAPTIIDTAPAPEAFA